MGIFEKNGVFSLETVHTLYQMKADSEGVLLHLYYGAKTGCDMDYLVRMADRGFTGNPASRRTQRAYSLDALPQEYPCRGAGDYRASALEVRGENGTRTCELRFRAFRIQEGRAALKGLPYVRGDADTQTLEIDMEDATLGLGVTLCYHVFPEEDVIVRNAVIHNGGKDAVVLEKAASLSLDFPSGLSDCVHFYGRHNMERTPERTAIPHGCLAIGSRRGQSSHHHNPFVMLCDRHTTEDAGRCYGAMLVYSGNHLEEVEKDALGSVRLVMGLHGDGFAWYLQPGESLTTPEAILGYSGEGMNGLSDCFHRTIRKHILARAYSAPRPVLINSWEGMYFNFNREKLLELGREARDLGMDMLVLDDGWFGKREDDNTSLGDWNVNEKKLGCTMGELAQGIHALGLRFGLWFEPEMISEDSDLYRAHPDWALSDPDRTPMYSRNQLVLDMSREDVVDHVFNAMCDVLDHAEIDYVKWDFNRSVANVYSHALPPERQGEVGHRFMLGTYALLERLLIRYPNLVIEGCSGGGGRFDAGMLFYCPQIWCSDDTDAVERLEIQRGTSYGYPPCTMGSHVSASPNHQTGRRTPMHTRYTLARVGTFGYELNPRSLSEEEKKEIREQIADFHKWDALLQSGRYYRLGEMDDGRDYEAWMVVSEDRRTASVSLVMHHVRGNAAFPHVYLRGLLPQQLYQVGDRQITGAALMQGGYTFPMMFGDYPSVILSIEAV